ncbi:MAG: ATP synthase F1 subunit gamma [Verrucomicrobia bacterium GWF2_51_19]|nr:MAG: ATP synthase F1 subunit gamma [Verrucomicrobia bacterium GWF2_51_19]
MKGVRDIRRRIKSVKSTAQITRAMQLVAASKMKRAQDAALMGRPYALLLAEILNELMEHLDKIEHKFLEQREEKRRCVVVISTNKGMCGALNQNIFRQLPAGDNVDYVAIGKKAAQFLSRQGKRVLGEFILGDIVTFHDVQTVVHFVVDAFNKGEVDSVEVLFPRYKNTLVQEPTLRKLLPIVDFREELLLLYERMGIDVDSLPKDDRYFMLFEPSAKEILEKLPPLFVKQSLYQMLLESKASEHSSRMVAMKTATDNAESLIDDLTLDYNKARQAAITQEILEIAASQATRKL